MKTIKLIWYVLEYFFGWVRSLWIVLFGSIKKPSTFYGYRAAQFAAMYARRRGRRWRRHWDQSGKQQAVLAMTKAKLIVCSKMEIKDFQKANAFPKDWNARKVIQKYSYFKTDL